jgi:hypothetical protein
MVGSGAQTILNCQRKIRTNATRSRRRSVFHHIHIQGQTGRETVRLFKRRGIPHVTWGVDQ